MPPSSKYQAKTPSIRALNPSEYRKLDPSDLETLEDIQELEEAFQVMKHHRTHLERSGAFVLESLEG